MARVGNIEDMEKQTQLRNKEEEEEDESEQWTSRWSFILAAVGSAIGLGNFWRFPQMAFKYGGGAFFIPYYIALFFVGIPLMQLEMSLGQVFRRSATQSFGLLHPRFRGIGLAAATIAFGITTYYCGIIAWGNVMFIKSFYADIPWSIRGVNQTDVITIPKNHFLVDLLKAGSIYEPQIISTALFLGTVFMWFSVWIVLIKGQNFLSKAVWVTVILPIVTLLGLVIVGLTLPGAGEGIKQYIGRWEMSELGNGQMWVDAFGQIFFSLGVSTGVMSAYASLNPRNSDVVKDAAIVSICNCFFSFVSGFAVFSVVGYFSLESGISIEQLNKDNLLGGASLAFVTYPAALTLLDGALANVTSIVFFLTFYFLGIDSAFSLVESWVYNFRETPLGSKFTRNEMISATCVVGMILTTIFVSDFGSTLIDLADFYFSSCGLLVVGFLEAFVAGWVYNKEAVIEKVGLASSMAFDCLVLGGFFIFSILAVSLPHGDIEKGLAIGVSIAVGLAMILAGIVAGGILGAKKTGSFKEALYYVSMYSMDTLIETLNETITDGKPDNWKFSRVWCVVIKFICTPLLILLNAIRYEGLISDKGVDRTKLDSLVIQLLSPLALLLVVGVFLGGFFAPSWYRDPKSTPEI